MRLVGKDFWQGWAIIDPLLARGCLFTVAYFGILMIDVPYAWVAVSTTSDFVLNVSTAGHVRNMVLHYPWSKKSLSMYKFQRLLAPLFYVFSGVINMLYVGESRNKALFVVYTIVGCNYYHDLYFRVSSVHEAGWQTKVTPILNDFQGRLSEAARPSGPNTTLIMPSVVITPSSERGSVANSSCNFDEVNEAVEETSSVESSADEEKKEQAWLPRNQLHPVEFGAALVMEVLSASSPMVRLAGSADQDPASPTNLGLIIASQWGRVFFFGYMMVRQLGFRQVLHRVFLFDNILSRALMLEVAYLGFGLQLTSSGLLVPLVLSDFMYTMSLSGHVRVLQERYPFTKTTLLIYKLNRLYAPTIALVAGAMTYVNPGSLTNLGPYMLYLVMQINYTFDLFSRCHQVSVHESENHIIAAVSGLVNRAHLSARMHSHYAPEGERSHPEKPTEEEHIGHPTHLEFALIVTIEVLSSLSPVARIVSKDSTNANNSWVNSVVLSLMFARMAVWMFMSVRIRSVLAWRSYFVLDVLFGRCALVGIAYGGFILTVLGRGVWTVILVICDFLFSNVLCGHIRVMTKYYPWTATPLAVYKLQRLLSPVIFLFCIVVTTLEDKPSRDTSFFLLYVTFGILLYFDIFGKVSTARVPEVHKEKEKEAVPPTKELPEFRSLELVEEMSYNGSSDDDIAVTPPSKDGLIPSLSSHRDHEPSCGDSDDKT